jgi:quinol monooxygenase YgiN
MSPANQPLNVVAILKAKPGAEQDVRALLQAALPAFQAEPGCLAYTLLTDKEQPTRFLSYETWTDEAALQAHFKAPTMTAATPKLKDLLAEPMELIRLAAFEGSTV